MSLSSHAVGVKVPRSMEWFLGKQTTFSCKRDNIPLMMKQWT